MSEEYKRGYEDCKRDIANDPTLLFEILPSMAKSAQEKLDTYKGELSEKQKNLINDALAGKIMHETMLAELRKTIQDA